MSRAYRHHHLLGLSLSVALGVAAADAAAVTGAELIRNTPQRYGRFEARLMFAPGDGIVSSMFLWKLGSELEDAYWNEIDLEKVGTDCLGYSSNAIYGNPESQHTERVVATSDLCTGYHTHAIEWTPSAMRWLLDGVEVRRLSPEALAAFEQNATTGMQVRFNLWVGNASFGGTFSPTSLPAHQYIEWVAFSSYSPGSGPGGSDFTPLWRDDFQAPLGAEWSFGTWASPLGNSTHSPANVTLQSGVAVLSLTDDAATGFAGTPPVDPGAGGSAGAGGSGGATGGAGGSAASGAAGAAGLGESGSGSLAGTPSPAPGERPLAKSGCGFTRPGPLGTVSFFALAGLVGICHARRRWRARLS